MWCNLGALRRSVYIEGEMAPDGSEGMRLAGGVEDLPINPLDGDRVAFSGIVPHAALVGGPGGLVQSHIGINRLSLVANPSGQIAFAQEADVWAGTIDALEQFEGEGRVVGSPTINDHGHILYYSIYPDSDNRLRSNASGTLTDLEVEGGSALFRHFGINNLGQTYTIRDSREVLVGDGTSLQKILGSGDEAPDSNGDRFDYFEGLLLNSHGDMALGAVMKDSGDRGVWATSADGELKLLARDHGPAPGFEGSTIAANTNHHLMPSINALGMVAFTALLAGGEHTDKTVVYVFDSHGRLLDAIVQGEELELAPDDVRTVTSVLMPIAHSSIFPVGSNNEDGRVSPLSDRGELLVAGMFGKGDFLFVVPIAPELAADFDDDGDVEENDLLVWQHGFGTARSATYLDGDADGDRDVDGGDFLAWQRTAGSQLGSAGVAVPEPRSLMCLLLGVAAWRSIGLTCQYSTGSGRSGARADRC